MIDERKTKLTEGARDDHLNFEKRVLRPEKGWKEDTFGWRPDKTEDEGVYRCEQGVRHWAFCRV